MGVGRRRDGVQRLDRGGLPEGFEELRKIERTEIQELHATDGKRDRRRFERGFQQGARGDDVEIRPIFMEVPECGNRLRRLLDLVKKQQKRVRSVRRRALELNSLHEIGKR